MASKFLQSVFMRTIALANKTYCYLKQILRATLKKMWRSEPVALITLLFTILVTFVGWWWASADRHRTLDREAFVGFQEHLEKAGVCYCDSMGDDSGAAYTVHYHIDHARNILDTSYDLKSYLTASDYYCLATYSYEILSYEETIKYCDLSLAYENLPAIDRWLATMVKAHATFDYSEEMTGESEKTSSREEARNLFAKTLQIAENVPGSKELKAEFTMQTLMQIARLEHYYGHEEQCHAALEAMKPVYLLASYEEPSKIQRGLNIEKVKRYHPRPLCPVEIKIRALSNRLHNGHENAIPTEPQELPQDLQNGDNASPLSSTQEGDSHEQSIIVANNIEHAKSANTLEAPSLNRDSDKNQIASPESLPVQDQLQTSSHQNERQSFAINISNSSSRRDSVVVNDGKAEFLRPGAVLTLKLFGTREDTITVFRTSNPRKSYQFKISELCFDRDQKLREGNIIMTGCCFR